MLFLGAGASKPFGVPIMRDLTKDIVTALSEEQPPLQQYFSDIVTQLNEFGFRDPDIEAIMDVLTARQDLNRARLSVGPRIIELANKPANLAPDSTANGLLDIMKFEIEARCSRADFHSSDAYFEKLFREVPSGRVNGVPTVFAHIFTTNYDLCIDKFLRGKQHHDGFAETSGFGRVFVGNWPDQTYEFTFCKLHGSVNWFEVEGRITRLDFLPGQSFMGEEVRGRMMVYPASEKYALTSPYAECLFFLRQTLKSEREPVIVVGYSFRDAPINNAFIDAIKGNPSIKIFSLGPRASAHQYELEEPLKSKVVPVDAEFGSDYTIQALSRAIRGG